MHLQKNEEIWQQRTKEFLSRWQTKSRIIKKGFFNPLTLTVISVSIIMTDVSLHFFLKSDWRQKNAFLFDADEVHLLQASSFPSESKGYHHHVSARNDRETFSRSSSIEELDHDGRVSLDSSQDITERETYDGREEEEDEVSSI